MAVLLAATPWMLMEFFRFCLHLKLGKNGRKLKGISKLSALGQDWKSFLRYYKGATKVPLDTELGRKINKVRSIYVVESLSLPCLKYLSNLDPYSVCGNWLRSSGLTTKSGRRPQCILRISFRFKRRSYEPKKSGFSSAYNGYNNVFITLWLALWSIVLT
jgi:hypothetical protein